MNISKITFAVIFVLIIALVIFVARFAYSVGQNNASLTVREVTPIKLAEAMQSDGFYGKYTKTMLLVNGTVQNVTQQRNDTLVQLAVTKSPSALGKVTCDLGSNPSAVKIGDTIRVLTVAHDAERQHGADVFMPNCYLLK